MSDLDRIKNIFSESLHKRGVFSCMECLRDHALCMYRSMLLTGPTGTGKSCLHKAMQCMLVAHLTERQAKLVIIDHKRIEYNSYDKQASHLLTPILTNPLQGVAFLSSLVNGSMDAVIGSRSVFIHIEECDMYAAHPEAFNYIVRAIARSDNLHLVYSTSRPAQEHVAQWLVDFGDAIVFSNPPHERILVTKYGNRALPRLSEECSEYLMNDFTLTLKE